MTDAAARQMNASLAAMTFRWSPVEWVVGDPPLADAAVRYQLTIESAVVADVKLVGQYRFTITPDLVEAGEHTVSFESVKELRFTLRRVE